MKRKVVEVIFFVIWIAVFCRNSAARSCGILSPPKNGFISGCSRGSKQGSVCTARCGDGFRPEQNIRLCLCIGYFCFWEGSNPVCEGYECESPEYQNGRVTIVDEWTHGFAGLIEFPEIPLSLAREWSVVIVFDRSVGPNARMSSWSSSPTSVSSDHKSFTLSNINYGRNATGRTSTDFRSLFVVTDIEGKIPSKGFVGMYNRRMPDASCFKPSSPIPVMETLPFSFSTTTTAPTTTTTAAALITTTTEPTTTEELTTDAARILLTKNKTTNIMNLTTMPFEANYSNNATAIPHANTSTSTQKQIENDSNPQGTTSSAIMSSSQIKLMTVDGMQCKYQRANNTYRTQPGGWVDKGVGYFSGNVIVNVREDTTEWLIVVVFQRPLASLTVWNTIVDGNLAEGMLWKLGPRTYNYQLHPGMMDVNFIAATKDHSASHPIGDVYLCSSHYSNGDPVMLPQNSNVNSSIAIVSTITTTTPSTSTTASSKLNSATNKKPRSLRCRASTPNGKRATSASQTRPIWKKSTDGTKYDYNELLHKSTLFYEAQRSGYLPGRYKRIPWRGHSMLQDGCSIGVDLSRGWFDAGDTVKFTFPMASAVSTLAWGGIAYRKAYNDSGVLKKFLGSVRWPVEFLIRAHTAPNELVGLIGNIRADHENWNRPEDWTAPRPVFKITKSEPGSELAAETAAALASSSILFKKTKKRLSNRALLHAKTLYTFATKYRGEYHIAIPQVTTYYRSNGYKDELIWAAAWLYKATKQKQYLVDAERVYRSVGGPYLSEQEYSWDRKMIGAQILLANLTGKEIYRSGVVRFMNFVMTSKSKTPQGMLWIRRHGPNRYAANAAFMAILAYGLEPPLPHREMYLAWARKQIHLLLGDAGRSFVVGFGKNYPKRPHHRASSCPPPPAPCSRKDLLKRTPNPFILYGALVGGPNKKGVYTDNRANYVESEVAVDYNAGFMSAVAGLKYYAMLKKASKKS